MLRSTMLNVSNCFIILTCITWCQQAALCPSFNCPSSLLSVVALLLLQDTEMQHICSFTTFLRYVMLVRHFRSFILKPSHLINEDKSDLWRKGWLYASHSLRIQFPRLRPKRGSQKLQEPQIKSRARSMVSTSSASH